MRVLTLSNLYPNPAQPRKGVFVRERLRHLEQSGKIEATVIAPVPWFPFKQACFGQYGEFARVPRHSEDRGKRVFHPRYALVPRLGAKFAPLSYAAAVKRTLQHERLGDFDAVDAHFFFPDGPAAVLVARELGIPVVITARGSDLNVMADDGLAGPWIRDAIRDCDAAIGVSASLGEKLLSLGCDRAKMHVLRNGVDRERFRVMDREECRKRTGLSGRIALSVGNLVPVKGHDLGIKAIANVPDATLVIVGRGPEEKRLRSVASQYGVSDRVQFVAEITQDALVEYYNAADVLLLPSRSEGMPNVVLESMACGTPVVASGVGGVLEILAESTTGEIVHEREPAIFAGAVQSVLQRGSSPTVVRNEISSFDWQLTTKRLTALFEHLTSAPQTASSGGSLEH